MASSSSSTFATKEFPPALNFYPKNTSLQRVEFASSCPPDISPRTRVIAICGITDINGVASPAVDGWFFSDFWMFNHLLRGAPVANQIWLTCCKPKDLISSYGRYSHGNPSTERRVVLEEAHLKVIHGAGTLRVVEPKLLLEHFLKTVEDECKAAVKANQEVLLMVFGHGDEESYGVTIGSNSNKEFQILSAPRLKIKDLKIAVSNAQCTLLITSCFSGGWAMHPDLNMTVIAAAGHNVPSQSWNTSSSRTFSGSVVASAIRDAIFASEVQDEENLRGRGMEYGELKQTETFAQMGCLIYDHLRQSDRFHSDHQISFAAQDDEWTKAWRKRTGIPLASFKDRWEQLTILPAMEDTFSNRDPASTLTASMGLENLSLSENRFGSITTRKLTMSISQIYSIIRALAAGYAKSFPGADNLSINTGFHTHIRLLLSGNENYEDRTDFLLTLGSTLSYRLDSMNMATFYKNHLELDYLDCVSCSIEGWTYPLHDSKEPEAKERLSRHNTIRSMILTAKIFSAASSDQGYTYNKPPSYLAIALVESGRSRLEVEQDIEILKKLHANALAPKVEAIRRGRWFQDKAEQILKPVKKTLRSISPRKRKSVVPSN